MEHSRISRREFLEKGGKVAAGFAAASLTVTGDGCYSRISPKPSVSVVRIKNDRVGYAVEEAIDLIGGIGEAARGKELIMLKPNLVNASPSATTKPHVIEALARLMKSSGKEVLIGEGSAAAEGFNVQGEEVFRTRNREILDGMQQHVFDTLGYSDLAKSLKVPLVNLHTGEMDEVKVPGAFVFDKLTLHRSLREIDLLCSVPMMKTHGLAHVTLGMKNLVGVFPGVVYQSVRGHMHDVASAVEPSATAGPVVDMVRANKLGLVVVDASTAMEGQGPAEGDLVKMDLIIAGTNPLATDMVTSSIMGFDPREIPTFTWANDAGLTPTKFDEIEVRGEKIENVRRDFARPEIRTWEDVRKTWAIKEI
jgi:uncharacterized protein (DUF362 family)